MLNAAIRYSTGDGLDVIIPRELPRPFKNWGAPWLIREIRIEVPVSQRRSSLWRSKLPGETC
jgi:hypothetical protein